MKYIWFALSVFYIIISLCMGFTEGFDTNSRACLGVGLAALALAEILGIKEKIGMKNE